MRLSIPRLPTRGTGTERRRAAVVVIVCGVVVALVAASVFSIQHASRRVVGHATSLHAINETLRAVTVARSQTAFAAYLASVDARFHSDSSSAIETTLADARRGVADAVAAGEAADDGSSLASPRARTLIHDFSQQADRTMALVAAGRPQASRRATGSLDRIFVRVRGDLVRRRDEALTAIAADDLRLWRLGALASFVAVFVAPCGILFVSTSLTRRSRASVEAQIGRDRERARAERQRDGVEAALNCLRAAILESERTDTPVPMAPLDDLAALLRAADGGADLRLASVPIAALLDEVATGPRTEALTISVKAGDEAAWADRDALRHVVGCLVLEARAAGARRVALVGGGKAGYALISVLHDGAPLPAAVAESLARARGGLLDPAPGAARPSARLLVAIAVAEGMGADLHTTNEPGPALMVRIPRAGGAGRAERGAAPVAAAEHA